MLDEPSIGLHPRDLNRIVEAMHRLRDAGNTLVVVEHDPSVMLAADRLIDMGPGPGERGGPIMFDGAPGVDPFDRHADRRVSRRAPARRGRGALVAAPCGREHAEHRAGRPTEHNLRDVTVEIPLRRLVCVTGVSGSGKSTLLQDVLYPATGAAFRPSPPNRRAHSAA